MADDTNVEHAVELLQELGLKEYEAKAFVALARLPRGTAKEISEISEVPRTRVYDAVRVLEAKGLVEIQHSNPQQFRAVPIGEATRTLRTVYESRAEDLRRTLDDLEPANRDDESKATHEVWSLSGTTAIANRTQELLDGAEREIAFVVGDDEILTEALVNCLRDAADHGVSTAIGTSSEAIRAEVGSELPDGTVYVSGLDWLDSSERAEDTTEISRLLLVDGHTILVSTFHRTGNGGGRREEAVFGRGFDNGLVTIVRRILATVGAAAATE